MAAGSNYPPGVTGGEAYLVGDDAPDPVCDHDGATLLSMAEGGFPGQYACSRCGEPFRPTNDLAADEDEEDVEIDEELEISGQYEDLFLLEIPLEAEHFENLLGKPYDVPRYAVLGVPKLGLRIDDRSAIQRVLYALATRKEPSDG